MKTQLLKKLFTFILIAIGMFSFSITKAQIVYDSTDAFIIHSMKKARLPGLAAIIIKNGKIALTKSYGYANIEKNIPFTPNTINAEIASIGKTITATALMQLWEQGYFGLDDNINSYLPFMVNNPFFPANTITFRMLLTHTSSIQDRNDLLGDLNSATYCSLGTCQSLESFVEDYFVPGGGFYVDSLCYYNYAPGSTWNYSNIAYALIGYLVEHISGTPFDEYCNEHIFQPLCMNHTGWHFSDVDTNVVSRPYYYDDASHSYIDYGLYEYPDYPDGSLKSSALDLSRFLLTNMNYGTLDGATILDSSTVAMMRTIQFVIDSFGYYHYASQGLCWFYSTENGNVYWGHDGDDFGISTAMHLDETNKNGIIIFTNGEHYLDYACDGTDDILCELIKVADTLSAFTQPDLVCTNSFFPCEHGKTFWKNNANKWAINSVPMILGTTNSYRQNKALNLLNQSINGNASMVLAKELIAAKLNVAQGCELSPIVLTIDSANNLIADRHLPILPKITFNSTEGQKMGAFAARLSLYNHGTLNTQSCTGNGLRETDEQDISNDNGFDGNDLSISPNPFSQYTLITFQLSSYENVSLKIFDVEGRLIRTLADNAMSAGAHTLTWDARDENGNAVSAEIYLLKIQSPSSSQLKKLIVTK